MRKIHPVFYVMLISAVLLFATSSVVSATEVPRMSPDELKSRLGEAGLVVLDVRSGRDWNQSGQQIASSERVDPGGTSQWADHYPKDRTMVLYCA